MNKGAGEMDEGSGVRQERDRDGWSLAVQGHSYEERQFTDAQRRSGRGFGKNDKSRSWGRRDNEQRQRKCVCVQKGDTEAKRETWRKKEKFIGENWERRKRCTQRDAKIMRFRKCL